MIEITQGYDFSLLVPEESTLIIKGENIKYIINSIQEEDKWNLFAPASITSGFIPGNNYTGQILGINSILSTDTVKIIQNLAFVDADSDIRSKNEMILEAIEAKLAGKATSDQNKIICGDKTIEYMSINELLRLRDYFKVKVDQENGKTNALAGAKIKYCYRGF